MPQEWINALIGGAVIGLAVSVMLLFNGRVTGVSGIIGGILSPTKGDVQWRVLFVLGLVFGGFFLKNLSPQVFSGQIATESWTLVLAGILVGFGTLLGSGCTSGHGVCGMSRLSIRSVIATVAFILAGILSVIFFRSLGVLP
ncbi:MAG: YeeE/YedE thiosulfate transporter family protein [Bdellovibrionota bacterium]